MFLPSPKLVCTSSNSTTVHSLLVCRKSAAVPEKATKVGFLVLQLSGQVPGPPGLPFFPGGPWIPYRQKINTLWLNWYMFAIFAKRTVFYQVSVKWGPQKLVYTCFRMIGNDTRYNKDFNILQSSRDDLHPRFPSQNAPKDAKARSIWLVSFDSFDLVGYILTYRRIGYLF